MRRVIALVVVALVSAGAFGAFGTKSAVGVNGSTVALSEFHSELSTLSHSYGLRCYYSALANANIAAGAGNDSVSAAASSAWSNLRIQGLAIVGYVEKTLHFHPTPADLAAAQSSLAGEMTQSAATASYSCQISAAQAIAAMPATMRAQQIRAQADSMYLVSTLKNAVALTPASLRQYFSTHSQNYRTLCVSVAVVAPTQANAFVAAEKTSASVATLAKEFSVDPSKAKGGALGCFAPGSTSYATVRGDVAGLSVGHFDSAIHYINYNGSTDALFIAITSVKSNPFNQVASVVYSDVQKSNATSANTVEANLLFIDSVVVNAELGRWGLATSGPSVFVSNLPKSAGTSTSTLLTTAPTTSYR